MWLLGHAQRNSTRQHTKLPVCHYPFVLAAGVNECFTLEHGRANDSRMTQNTRGTKMKSQTVLAVSAMTLALTLAGCASDGSLALSTGSINEEPQQAKAQRIDPACVSLMARIDALRKEGTPERLAKVAAGKTKTASVKRESLARMAELDKVNGEFQQKCSTLAAPAAPPAAPNAAAAATGANAKTAAVAATTAAPAATTSTAAAKATEVTKKTAAVTTSAVTTASKTVAAAQ